MFAKSLPLDYNNQNYMYNMVRTEKKIVINDSWNNPALPHPESSPLPYPEFCLHHPDVCTDGEDDDTEGRGGIRISMKPKNRIKPGRPRHPRDAPPRVVILDEGVPPHGGPGDGELGGGAALLAAM